MNAYSRFILRLFPPKSIAHAEKIKHRLAVTYAVVCWHGLFIIFYAAYTNNFSGTKEEKVQALMKQSQTSNLYEVKVKGFKIIEETYTKFPNLEEQEKETGEGSLNQETGK